MTRKVIFWLQEGLYLLISQPPNAYKSTKTDSVLPDAFITTLSYDGNSIVNSTFYGEPNYHDQSYFIELDSEDQVYIYGQTKAPGSSFIYNANYYVLDGGQFITAFSKDLSTIKKSTVFGTGRGTPDISPTAFLVDVCGNIYVSGWGSDVQGHLLVTPILGQHYQRLICL